MDETNSVQKLLDDLSRKKGISEISINDLRKSLWSVMEN